jgi:hypothetical protein
VKPLLKKVRITVTADDIKHGKREKCLKCPIARAALRRFGLTTDKVTVDSCEIRVYKSAAAAKRGVNPEARYLLPWDPAGLFVHHFDRGHPVKPLSFTMERVS